jgi:hypothetical protein
MPKQNPTKIANKIIALFINENVPISIQLEALKLARKKIEFIRKTGQEIAQHKLKL